MRLSTALVGALLLAAQSVAPQSQNPVDPAFVASREGVHDQFEYPDGMITSDAYYQPATFPNGGTSTSMNPSKIWECGSGGFFASSGWGYSGDPMTALFRANTRDFMIIDQVVRWKYRSGQFSGSGGGQAVSVWLRYQTQYWLYVLQFDRKDDRIVAKRKVPAQGWGGPPDQLSNKGVYYQLKTDAQQPIIGANQPYVTWENVKSLLGAEMTKPGFPNLAHDASPTGGTSYHFTATITSPTPTTVQIQLRRGMVLVASFTDNNDCLAPDGTDTTTFQDHWDAGHYNSVTGYQAAWGLPIQNPGASGFRADTIKCWFDNFTLWEE